MQTTISTRFDADTLTRLDEIAAAVGRPRSALIKEAVSRHLDYLAWYGGEIQKGLDDASVGRVKSADLRLGWRFYGSKTGRNQERDRL